MEEPGDKNKKQGENLNGEYNQKKNKVSDLDEQQNTQPKKELLVYSHRKNQQPPPTLETCHESVPESGNLPILSPVENF